MTASSTTDTLTHPVQILLTIFLRFHAKIVFEEIHTSYFIPPPLQSIHKICDKNINKHNITILNVARHNADKHSC